MGQTGRDHRVDFLRGFALASIFINHVPGNVYEKLTHRNFGFSDAAEIFVLLAGFASAYAYFARYERGETLDSSLKALKRSGVAAPVSRQGRQCGQRSPRSVSPPGLRQR